MFGIGALCGLILSIASKIFYVYEDPRIAAVEGHLAGANCGGCGYPGCSAAAVAVVGGKASPSVCLIAGPDSASNVAAVMGVEAGTAEPLRSYNKCHGGDRASDRYRYVGINSCRAVSALYGGKRECEVGCLGLGDCVKVCLFDAIQLGPDGYPVIDDVKCVGCGVCEKICPKNVLKVKTMSDRLLHFNLDDDCLAPCRQTCPAEIDIPQYISQIKNRDYEGAVHTIRERNPLLLSCGRVCPHPCETYCRRGIADEPVSINQLKRFAADFEMNSGRRLPIVCAPDTGKRVAVIGAGPAGLSCAYFLRRLGHGVTIYEAMPEMGGMIRYGIPEYRLPKKTLQWEIDGILNLGVKSHTNVRLGVDFDIPSLLSDGFDAIFWAWVPGKITASKWKVKTPRVAIPESISYLESGVVKKSPSVAKSLSSAAGTPQSTVSERLFGAVLKRCILSTVERERKCLPMRWKLLPPKKKVSSLFFSLRRSG
jgi:formate dehydrogenase beta subunit